MQELKVDLYFISIWLTCMNKIIDLKVFNKTEFIYCMISKIIMLIFPISSCIAIRLILACLDIHQHMVYFPFHIQRLNIQWCK